MHKLRRMCMVSMHITHQYSTKTYLYWYRFRKCE